MTHWLGRDPLLSIPLVLRAETRPRSPRGTFGWAAIPSILGHGVSDWPPQFRLQDIGGWDRITSWWRRLLPPGVDMAGVREALTDHLHHVVGRHLSHAATWERRTRNPLTRTRPVTNAEWLRELRWEIWLDHLEALIAAMPAPTADGRTDPAAALTRFDVHADPIGQLDGVGYGSAEGVHCAEVGDAAVLPRSVFGHGRFPALPWRATVTPEAVPGDRHAGLIVLGGGRLQVRDQGAAYVRECVPGTTVSRWPSSGGLEMAWRPNPATPGDLLILAATHEVDVAGLAWRPLRLLGGETRVVSRGELGTGAITLSRPDGDHTETKLVAITPPAALVETRTGAGAWTSGVPADAALAGTALARAPLQIRFRAG